MYCPNCAASNSDVTKFCRACGANLSLVPKAMTGELPGSRPTRHQKRHGETPPSIASGISKFFMGLGFLLVSAAIFFFAPAGKIWWFWMLLPAFGLIGNGIAEIVAAKMGQDATYQPVQQNPMPPPVDRGVMPPRTTGEIIPPPSVTEGTTRHLDSVSERYKENR